MIFTECPYCDEPQVFGWESGGPMGYIPSRCPKCQKVMWFECTSIGGETISHEDFKKGVMKVGDEQKIEEAAKQATVQSAIVY